jgi:hypothetical protein
MNNSLYFRDLFAVNPGQSSYDLPDDINPQCLRIILSWLYHGNDMSTVRIITSMRVDCEDRIRDVIDIYIVAHKLKFPVMEELAIGLLGLNYYSNGFGPRARDIYIAYRDTEPGSGLRHYIAISLCYSMMFWVEGQGPPDILAAIQFIPDLQADVFRENTEAALADGGQSRPIPVEHRPICDFHYHPGGAFCWAGPYTFASYPARW